MERCRSCFLGGLGVIAAALCSPLLAQPQEYPTREIQVVVPFAPDGPTDLTARAMAEVATEHLGVPVVIENRPGAGGMVGLAEVARAQPDGYRLAWTTPASAMLSPDFMVDLVDDLIPIAQMLEREWVLLVGADTLYDTLDELLEQAQNNPEEVVIATSGLLDRHPAAALAHFTGAVFRYVPFPGVLPATTAVHTGAADAFHSSISVALPRIRDGELRALAITGTDRHPELPDVPTYAELGLEIYTINNVGLIAPAGIPHEIIAILETAMREISEDPAYLERLEELGEKPSFLGAEAYREKLVQQLEGMQLAANGGAVFVPANGVSPDIRASRSFLGPHRYPDEPRVEFKAYGIVAFPAEATQHSRDRYLDVCRAYVATLPQAHGLPVPRSEQMVTVWPVGNDELADNLEHRRDVSVCEEAVDRYHLVTALQALEDARHVGFIRSGRGPFLLAWQPASEKGKRDVLVLAVNLSGVSSPERFQMHFQRWRDRIQADPSRWERMSTEADLLTVIGDWIDDTGSRILFLFAGRS